VTLVPSGDSCTAGFVDTAPTWSDSKQGYYYTGDYANYRAVGRAIKATAAYECKEIFYNREYGKDDYPIVCSLNSGTTSTEIWAFSVRYDNKSVYNDSTYRITIPEKGIYKIFFSAGFLNQSTTATATCYIGIDKNPSSVSGTSIITPGTVYQGTKILLGTFLADAVPPQDYNSPIGNSILNIILELNAGDLLYPFRSVTTGAEIYAPSSGFATMLVMEKINNLY
jgi:hypothetical protein